MQSVSSRIWTRVAVSIFYDDNHYIRAPVLISKGRFHLYNLMMSVIVIQILAKTGGLCHFRYERFINFWLRFKSTWGERHNSYYADHTIWLHTKLTPSPTRGTSCDVLKSQFISAGWDLKNLIAAATLCLNGPISTLCLRRSISTEFFQNPQILRTISSGHDVMHTPGNSSLGFIMTMVIAISFVRERKTTPNDYAPELLTRIVQSPTKLNDKI